MIDKSFNLTMDKVFKEHYGKNKVIFDNYQKIYGLSNIECKCEVSKKLFDYAKRKDLFLLLLLYNSEGKIYLDRNMSDKLYWDLPGSSIRDSETIHDALDRIAKRIDNKILIGDVEPIITITNVFQYDNQIITHNGLAFMARIRNNPNIDINSLKGDFIEINEDEMKYINRLVSKKVVELGNARIRNLKEKLREDFQEKEVNTNEQYKNRYIIHNNIMKRYILTQKRKRKVEFKKLIEGYIGKAKSIIDVSCGEDQFIFNLAQEKEMSLIVGNDISWSQIQFLNSKFDDVIFTNHNAAALPFQEDSFEIAYCSNTLHHMPNKITLVNMLESMFKISKKIIIVEIEDPKKIGGFPKWLNQKWFIGFLKDVGGAYLSKNEFEIIIRAVFKNRAKIKITNFKNIMGNYMIAEIEKEDVNV